ncbi:ABC transporter permease [Qiania dongpingensis]|uniref:ABC transporter permease n=1 Tax=Qiania dongpingensis TaxID=2763669 RepID=A0A7G9G371_9FIRM|nr:ABC transporter permease [Qiania dongpingensis]QNM05253.1 ABC transporter permease [Qiania dongpingensis]
MNNSNTVKNKITRTKFANFLGSMAGLFGLIIIFSILSRAFLTVDNVISITLSVAIYATLACGISFVLIIGGAELSAGSVVGVAGAIFCVSLRAGIPAWICIIITIGCGILCGLFNGFLVTKMHLIPFIATLGTQYIFRGATYIISSGSSISVREVASEGDLAGLKFIGSGKILGIPMLVYIMVICAVILTIVLSKTTLGRKIFATGSNVEAARLSGISTDKITTIAYMFSGGMAGLAGVMLTTRLLSAQPTAGTSFELEGIAASVIGGVSMMGGQGTIPGAVMGAFIVGIMRNGLNLLGVNTFWQQVITGVIIIVAVWADIMRRRREASKK